MNYSRINIKNLILILSSFLLIISCKHTSQTSVSKPTEIKVLKDSLFSKTLNKYVQYRYSLPQNYDESQSYPIIYLLHGHGGSSQDWFAPEGGNAAVTLSEMTNNISIPPMIAVSISADNSWYVDSIENWESFYIKEFIPYFEAVFNFSDQSTIRHITGLSAGGFGALRFSLKYPSLFQNVILLSPASYHPSPPLNSSSRKIAAFAVDGVFSDSLWSTFSYKHLQHDFLKSTQRPKFHISVGDDDVFNIVPVVTDLQQFFLKNGVINELRITDGGHDWACWNANFKDALSVLFTSKEKN